MDRALNNPMAINEDNDERQILLERQEQHDEPEPKDRFKIVYSIFFLLGMATLLPWNIFITAQKYFEFKLQKTNTEKTVENYIAIASMVPNVFFMFINMGITKIITLKVRLLSSLVIMILMFIITMIFIKVDTDSWEMGFFTITIVTVIIINASGAILGGGVFGLSGMFPHNYTQALMSGQGMGGTFAAVANIISLKFAEGDEIDSALWYFVSAVVVMVAALVAVAILPHLEFAKYYIEKHEMHVRNDIEKMNRNQHPHIRIQNTRSPLYLFKQVWDLAFSVFMVFFVTLSCFPGLNTKIESIHYTPKDTWTDVYFTPVTCFLLFNVGDLAGRTVAGFIQWPKSKNPLLPVLCFIRVAFIPLFMLCHIQPIHTAFPHPFNHDSIPIILTVLFAVSNGYFGTLCMMYGPKRMAAEHQEIAGTVMSFFLTLGLALGSLCSYGMVMLI